MKLPSIEPKTVTKKKYFLYCKRCEISTNTKGRMIPCPRGGCEAEVVGEIETTTITKFNPK